jgi:hypothetical protein
MMIVAEPTREAYKITTRSPNICIFAIGEQVECCDGDVQVDKDIAD